MSSSNFLAFARLVSSLVATALVFATLGMVLTGGASASDLSTATLYSPLTSSSRAGIQQETEGNLPVYEVEAIFTPAGLSMAQIEGQLDLEYLNISNEKVDEAYLRLYANLPSYASGAIDVTNVTVSGISATVSFERDDTLMIVDLPDSLLPGQSAALSMDFVSTIPTNATESYGMYEYDSTSGSYKLSHWMPLMAAWDEENGWHTEDISFRGDPVLANPGLFSVEVTAPSNLTFATTGSATDRIEDVVSTVHTWSSGPAREFVMFAGENIEVLSTQVGETTIRSFSSPEKVELSAHVLDVAAESLELFNELFGEYPYIEFDIVEAPIGPRAAGIEFPGLIYIGGSIYDPDNDFLDFTLVHEVAHQWWYGVVGNNQYVHAFLDESLTNYSATLYYEDEFGPEASQQVVDQYIKLPYFASLFGSDGDDIVDQPNNDFASNRSYGRIVYGKGALGFEALRAEIGDDAFFTALQNYFDEFQFETATPQDLLESFENASGQDLTEFWDHWFESADGDDDFNRSDLLEIT